MPEDLIIKVDTQTDGQPVAGDKSARAAQEVEAPVDSISAISRETENTRMLADQVSDAASDLAKEVSEFAEDMSLGIDATSGQK